MAHQYDYIIIGSGLAGLSIAAKLNQHTQNIALIEASDIIGGLNRPISFPTGNINNGLRFIPATSSSEQSLLFLENLLKIKIIKNVESADPITFEHGHLKTFLGFGDHPPEFYEEITYFANTQHYNLNIEPHQWPSLLFSKFTGDFFPRSILTKFHAEGGQITHVTINGSKTVHARNFIYCGPIRDLAQLLPEEAISSRARAKLKKNLYWTAICMDICHGHKVTDTANIHILNGTTQDELGPCTGYFHPAVEVNGELLQTSQWVTYMDYEATDDTEAIAHALKKIKRQIKRPYPQALDQIKVERIVVARVVSGHGELKLNANQTLPDASNLWIGSSAIHSQKNMIGALQQAQLVLASMGFGDLSDDPPAEPLFTP